MSSSSHTHGTLNALNHLLDLSRVPQVPKLISYLCHVLLIYLNIYPSRMTYMGKNLSRYTASVWIEKKIIELAHLRLGNNHVEIPLNLGHT